MTKFYACYDGKMGRAMPVKVLKKRGCFMLVEFTLWASKPAKRVRVWFPPDGGAWVRHDHSLMAKLYPIFSVKEMPGDWYRLVPAERLAVKL
jgi:hypothetical protein